MNIIKGDHQSKVNCSPDWEEGGRDGLAGQTKRVSIIL